jgi:hypothetical protein
MRNCLSPVLLLGLLSWVSCGNDDAPGGGEAGTGDEPTAGKQTQGGSGGAGGNGLGAAGSASGGAEGGVPGDAGSHRVGGGACGGDADAWDAIIAAPVECETDDDCCVVVNSCLAEAQVVHADDFDTAQIAWPYCEEDCTDCIPPAVIVACDNGQCVGTVDLDGQEDGVSHCGDTTLLGDDPGRTFTCQ